MDAVPMGRIKDGSAIGRSSGNPLISAASGRAQWRAVRGHLHQRGPTELSVGSQIPNYHHGHTGSQELHQLSALEVGGPEPIRKELISGSLGPWGCGGLTFGPGGEGGAQGGHQEA